MPVLAATPVRPLPAGERAATLERLAEHCRFGRSDGGRMQHQPTGYSALDQRLPGGGWPLGALVELLPEQSGIGEFTLLMPALRALAQSGRHLACIAPPWLPYPPALAQQGLPLSQLLLIRATGPDIAWSLEQCLRCTAFGAVLGWCDPVDERSLRRLQLAAETGGGIGWLYRPVQTALLASPAALRLQLAATAGGELRVQIRKARGGAPGVVVVPAAAAA